MNFKGASVQICQIIQSLEMKDLVVDFNVPPVKKRSLVVFFVVLFDGYGLEYGEMPYITNGCEIVF